MSLIPQLRTPVPPRNGVARVKRIGPVWVAMLPALALLAACGGGGSGTGPAVSTNVPAAPPPPHVTLTPPPVRTPATPPPPAPLTGFQLSPDVRLTPVIPVGAELRIGAMPLPGAAGLQEAPNHDRVTVRHGRVRDGVGASLVIRYLREENPIVYRFRQRPVVRWVEGVTARHGDEIRRAVRILNGNLPGDFRIGIGPPVSASEDARLDSVGRVTPGQIIVEYDRREEWESGTSDERTIGLAWIRFRDREYISARVWVDHTRLTHPTQRMSTLMHELLHALGRDHPDNSKFPRTVMNTGRSSADRRTKYDLMYPLDREVLLAVYGTLYAGDSPIDIAGRLGSWENESLHVRGELGNDIAFGAALRNGLVRPWASGPKPAADLADNTALTGRAAWAGRLLGLTPGGATVAGAAGLAVDLASLRGDLDFTAMEQWTGRPGAPGSGTRWGDGDLGYGIAVEGNTFSRRAGPDEGIVTGAFFGNSHQGMGGTLVRDDLSAGFAGTR